MNNSKAKKAVSKCNCHKKNSDKTAELALALQAAGGGAIDPEVQAARVDMQPADGYVNPYHAMGTMAPTNYSAGNMLDGYNYPVMVNPEA